MDSQPKTLKEIFLERAEAKGLNVEKIFQAVEIPRHYLDAIFRGDWKKLPAAPYVQGYFKKLAPLLEWDASEMWALYQNETDLLKISGAGDKLPENRFAIKRKNRGWAWLALALGFAAFYGFLNADRFLGKPELEVTNPFAASIVTALQNFTLSGKAEARDKVFINGEEVFIDNGGEFQKNYILQPGLNTFEISAKRFLGRETKVVKQIIYQNEKRF